MASIRKRGNSYLLVVSMGYTPDGQRRNPQQKTVKPPTGLTPKQTEKWLQEQAMIFEMSCKKLNPGIDRSITLEKYTEIWLQKPAPRIRSLLRSGNGALRQAQTDERRLCVPQKGHETADDTIDLHMAIQENLESKRSSDRPERPQSAPHGGKPVHRQRHGRRHGRGASRTQSTIDHAGYLHARIR